MKRAEAFELIDHGIEGASYFQGCGTSHTQYTDVATGNGNNPAEAIDDALESLAQQGWDSEDLEARIKEQEGWKEFPTSPDVETHLIDVNPDDYSDEDGEFIGEDCDTYYYVSIRVR
jgi:hypothetical protein